MGVSVPVRLATYSIMALLVGGLLWRAWGLYQADQRAVLAASLVKAEPARQATDGSRSTAGKALAEAEPSGTQPCTGADEQRQIQVHVEGAVQKPGVYTLAEGSRIHEAIAAAGGALPNGVPGALNLATLLTDGTKLYIYTREELRTPSAQAQPPTSRDASFAPVKETASQSQESAASSGPVIVHVNSATAAELERVPGIGPATARAILEYRSKHGPFQTVDDLTNVSGIGPKTLEKLRPYLRV